MSDPFLGEIRMFAGSFAPQGWAMCNGQLLPISQNAALFSLLGTYFGGDGVSTFALPDLRGRVPVHQGQGNGLSPYTIGQISGRESVTLLESQMPVHSHQVACDAQNAGGTSPGGALLGSTIAPYSTGAPNATMMPSMIGPAGGNQPVPILDPSLCVTFIIALSGLYPSRS